MKNYVLQSIDNYPEYIVLRAGWILAMLVVLAAVVSRLKRSGSLKTNKND